MIGGWIEPCAAFGQGCTARKALLARMQAAGQQSMVTVPGLELPSEVRHVAPVGATDNGQVFVGSSGKGGFIGRVPGFTMTATVTVLTHPTLGAFSPQAACVTSENPWVTSSSATRAESRTRFA